jgi:hypothetical protein
MNAAMWWFAALASLAAAGCAQAKIRLPLTTGTSQCGLNSAPAETRPLFIIERSKNANTVHYDARLTADGKLDPEEPVIAYYIMLAEDGRRKELNWIEKKLAYGFDIEPDPSANGYTMTMVAARERRITVRQEGTAIRAELVIDGQPAAVEKMYIKASDGLIWPKVHYIELYGEDLRTAERRFERVLER